MTNLSDWLASELEERAWSMRELSRRAGVSHSQVSDVISGKVKPSAEFCFAISGPLGKSPEWLLRLAGLLPPGPTQEQEDQIREIAEMLASLPDGPIREQAMRAIIAIARDAREMARERAGG